MKRTLSNEQGQQTFQSGRDGILDLIATDVNWCSMVFLCNLSTSYAHRRSVRSYMALELESQIDIQLSVKD